LGKTQLQVAKLMGAREKNEAQILTAKRAHIGTP